MDFPRGQIDALIARGIDHNDQLHVPHSYDDPGRVDYEPGRGWSPDLHGRGHCAQRDDALSLARVPVDIAHLVYDDGGRRAAL